MTRTLLFDLDDTLLSNQLEAFLPAYLQALSHFLSGHFSSEALITHLLAATKKMLQNDDPARTLKATFDSHFFAALGIDQHDIQKEIDLFYQDIYPSLENVTSRRPEAVRLIDHLLQSQDKIVIATNPLFPRSAIEQRLKWAGLDPDTYPFLLITSYENFHFSKPNPAYFAEILAQIGWPEGPAFMIGNSLSDDILPSLSLGLHAFLVNPGNAGKPLDSLYSSGDITDILPWLETSEPSGFSINKADPEALIAVLISTPAALDTLCASLTPAEWNMHVLPGEWNLTQIVSHMRDVAFEVDLPRICRVLKENNPFIPGIATDVWSNERRYDLMNGREKLDEFTTSRKDLIGELIGLPPEGWEQPARHGIFGPTKLRELVEFIALHDMDHVRQAYHLIQASKAQSVELLGFNGEKALG